MLLFAHAALLGIHLLQTLVFGKSLEQFLFKFVFHSALLGLAFSLQSQLKVFCILKFLFYTFSFLHLCALPRNRCLFALLEV